MSLASGISALALRLATEFNAIRNLVADKADLAALGDLPQWGTDKVNYLMNSGFEDYANLSGWSQSGGWALDSGYPYKGNNCASVTATGAVKTLTSLISMPVKQGDTAKASIALRTAMTGTGYVTFNIVTNTGVRIPAVQSNISINSPVYTTYTAIYVVPAGVSSVTIEVIVPATATSGSCRVDECVLKKALDISDVAGVTATATEVNYLSGVTSPIQTQLGTKAASTHSHLLAVGATDVTATAAELNILDGAILTVTELNYVDGVTGPIQTQFTNTNAAIVAPKGRMEKTTAGPAVAVAGTYYQVTTFTSVLYNTGTLMTSSTGRILIPSAGVYRVVFSLPWSSYGTAYSRTLAIALGTTAAAIIASKETSMLGTWQEQVVLEDTFAANDILTFWIKSATTGSGAVASTALIPPTSVSCAKVL